MAALTWYLTSSLAGTAHQGMSETDPGTEAFASPVYGFVTGTLATGNFASADAQTEVASASFGATAQPDGSIVTSAGAGDCWASTTAYNGTFSTGNWVAHMCIRANTTAGGTSRGRCRIFSGPNQDGTGATERTSVAQVGSTVTPSTVTTTDSTVTFSVTGWTTNGPEYILMQLGWETVTAGGMTTNDENFRVGNSATLGARLVSATFTAAKYSSAASTIPVIGTGVY